ncbi:hypothetical protein B0H16DRAFT_1711287 [Mycena metata]|uniref:Uncharacterized protein n=1 Tax=Mycena metata TaxID=1033252 RepID=A0AAD7K7T6_9AGAR|nr:hypothetical protein B0H16DRAFT_1711287 [Mycena metata]
MWLRIGKKKEPKGGIEMFDRERCRRLFCGSWTPPPGVLDHHLYGAPVPDFPFMIDTNGDGRLAPAKPSTWMYPTQFPSKAYHVGKRLSLPSPSRLPLLVPEEDNGANKGKSKATAADTVVATDMEALNESDYGDEDGMDVDDSDEEDAAPPSNVVVIDGLDENVSAAMFRGLATDALFQAHATPLAILCAQRRMWLQFADTTNGRRAQGALGGMATGIRATYTSEREFESAARYTQDIWTAEFEEDDPMPTTVSSFEHRTAAEDPTPATVSSLERRTAADDPIPATVSSFERRMAVDDPIPATVSSFERRTAADDMSLSRTPSPVPEVAMIEEQQSPGLTSASRTDFVPGVAPSPPAVTISPAPAQERCSSSPPASVTRIPPLPSLPAVEHPLSPAPRPVVTRSSPPPPSSFATRSSPPIRSRAPLEERLEIRPPPRVPPAAPRAMLRPLEQRLSFAPMRLDGSSAQRETRPLPQRNTVPLYHRLSSAIPLGERLGPRNSGLLEQLSAPPIEHPRAGSHESGGTGKRKREVEAPVPPIASSSRTTLNSIKGDEVDEGRTHKKVRRGKRSGRLVREYEQRKAERANKTEGVVNERDEESETQAHLESVLQTVAEVAEAEDALAIAWDGEVAPAWAPEEDEDDAGPAKM